MLFNSVKYIIFIAVAVTLYYLLPKKVRNIFLLVTSYVFYMWAIPQYGVLVLFTTGLSYFAARLIDKTEKAKTRKTFLVISILLCISFLVVFKYYNFFMEELTALMSLVGVAFVPAKFTLALPMGLSFYTFQVIGYNVDVYNKKVESEKNFIDYALFVSFFPQILAGPIGRANEMLPQYKQEHKLEYSNIVEGLQRFLTGAFKKVVIADGLGKIVDAIYGNIDEYAGLTLFVAVVAYALQIYFDFSGYTDMAIGSGKLFGFTLRENFRTPYLATNMGDFWLRWHMSLTSWFRDYVYIPLGGNRKGFLRKLLNVLIVFFLSGLWHGASENYIVWGLWLAFFRIIEELVTKARGLKKTKYKTKAGRIFGRLYTDIVVVVGWIFFRLSDFSKVKYVFYNLFKKAPVLDTLRAVEEAVMVDGVSRGGYMTLFYGVMILSLGVALMLSLKMYRSLKQNSLLSNNPLALYTTKARWLLYWFMGIATVIFFIIARSGDNSSAQFIYLGY